MSGHYRVPHPNPQQWPEEGIFKAFLTPNRLEADIHSLVVTGKVPKEIDGTFYRIYPDPAFPPYVKDDVWMNGDGIVSAFKIRDGHVDFKQRYVNTEKLQREKAARRALAGKYRNKFTDAVDFQVRTTANTNIVYHNGMLLACKEDGPPYAMNCDTLETYGAWNFHGQMESCTFTAHPKFDPVTKDMVTMGYEAKGDATCDVCYYVVNATGMITQTVWTTAPFAGMIHDFAFTDNWIVFPMIPIIANLERMQAGGEHFTFHPEEKSRWGVIPRYGATGKEIKWFKGEGSTLGHLSNVFEDENGIICADLVADNTGLVISLPGVNGNVERPPMPSCYFRRQKIDPHSDKELLPPTEVFGEYDSEFPRWDERLTGKDYTHVFLAVRNDDNTDWEAIEDKRGSGFMYHNTLGHFNLKTKEWKYYSCGRTSMVQEPVYFPRSADASEGDGFVVAVVSRYDTYSTDLIIMDTNDWTEPAAIVHLPCKLRFGIHGNWVDAADRHETVIPDFAKDQRTILNTHTTWDTNNWETKYQGNPNGVVNGQTYGQMHGHTNGHSNGH